MRNASAALIALLNSASEFAIADLLTLILQDGTITRLTNAGISITCVSQYDNASHTFVGGGVEFRRSRTKLVVGLEVDAMELMIMTTPSSQTIEGLPWPQQAIAGLFDEAHVMLERLIMPSWAMPLDVSAGTLIDFSGRVGVVEPSRDMVKMIVNSGLDVLALPMPRNVYQPQCLHALYDTGCSLSQVAFTVGGSVHSGSTVSAIKTGLTAADGYYELGAITFSSGANNGLSRTVKTYLNANGLVTPVKPFPYTPQAGDTFTIYPGCDKVGQIGGDIAAGTCQVKFSNIARFKGTPFVPSPENAR